MEYVTIRLDPNWSAEEIAASFDEQIKLKFADMPWVLEAYDFCRSTPTYRIQSLLTPDEKAEMGNIPLLLLPLCDHNAWIALPPSKKGMFIAVDIYLHRRLQEFISAPSLVAWQAVVMRAAFSKSEANAVWLEDASRSLMQTLASPASDGAPGELHELETLAETTYCHDFIVGHEYSHFLLGHINLNRTKPVIHFSNIVVDAFDFSDRDEFYADFRALDILSRSTDLEFSAQLIGALRTLALLGLIEYCRLKYERIRGYDDPEKPAYPETLARFMSAYIRGKELLLGKGMSPDHPNLKSIDRLRQMVEEVIRKLLGVALECYACDRVKTMEVQESLALDYSLENQQRYISEMKDLVARAAKRQKRLFNFDSLHRFF